MPIKADEEDVQPSMLTDTWLGLSQEVLIPYDKDKRKEILSTLYSPLTELIAYYSGLRRENIRDKPKIAPSLFV